MDDIRTFHTRETRPDDDTLGLDGGSQAIEDVRAAIRRFAPLPAPVLVTGETGTGKELVARAVHRVSRRQGGPFVALSAAALPTTLIATELFGHERGAFTGATQRHIGAFEQAHGGTLFLDEVAELPLDLQAWLLRVLESGEVRRLGAERAVRVDVRVVAATHVDLAEAVRSRRLRADLYWRLAVLPVRTPSLRERLGDIPDLVARLSSDLRLGEAVDVRPCALQALALHDWPGNVRELRSVLLRAAASATDRVIDATAVVRAIGASLGAAQAESRTAASALLATRGNKTAAARLVGLPRSTFRDRLRTDRSN